MHPINLADQPQATVIRERHIQSIDCWQVVKDDLLIVKRGDQILVDGLIVSNQSLTLEGLNSDGVSTQQVQKQVGDPLFAGSYCISGHVTYQTRTAMNQIPAVLLRHFRRGLISGYSN